ncbi:MAG TPA: LLM class F420-dependent oxidoreductase [Ilumatobacteraceae bacterium]|nr:LLM class F420-dependent oxidoreductase [Ilumatobacteraceae bacterium]
MTNPNIRFGLQIPLFTYPGVATDDLFERVSDIAVTAEDSGFDSVFVMDHFYQLPGLGAPQENMFEAYTLLSALAACTHTVRLGCMVGGMTYRNPAFLVKTVTCLDVISKGRAIWGIGAGWFEKEHQDYNFEFGTFTDRFEKLEEGLQIAKSMFVNDTTTFDGKWFKVTDAFNSPKPVQAGGPPILIGGSGEKKTLRMVAQYGDACNVFGDATQVRHLMGVLDEHCATIGRDPSEICRTRLGTLVVGETMDAAQTKLSARFGGASLDQLPADLQVRVAATFIVGDPDEVGSKVQGLLDAGLDGVVVNMPDAHDLEAVALAGSVLSNVFA